jgi:uncharacterized repeat protein (TIGR01451 family)
VQTPDHTFSTTDANESLDCRLNTDQCAGGVHNPQPLSHGHMAVRNVSTSQAFTGDEAPSSASATPGQTVEYRALYHNAGDGIAHAASASSTIPAGTDFVACSDACAQNGSEIAWNLGDVAAGATVQRTFQVKTKSTSTSGSVTNKVTGDDNEEAAFESNTTTLNFAAPPPPVREITIDIQESTINASNPKNGVTNVKMFDKTIVPSSVCFGDLDENQCTSGSDPSLGGNYLKMKFLIKNTGIDPGDTRACMRGVTTAGEQVHGCDSVVAQ